MSLLHYFSNDPNKRAKFIFNFIAPIYGRVDGTLKKTYSQTLNIIEKEIPISQYTVLDLGAGTGAWSAAIKHAGAKSVHGVDFSEKMLIQARQKHKNISFSQGDIENLSLFDDNSFDIVTASFVLHGVKQAQRKKILSEMNRITKKHIIINDFIGRTPVFVRILEFFERSDYKYFKQNFCNELKEIFPKVTKIYSQYGSGVYLANKIEN